MSPFHIHWKVFFDFFKAARHHVCRAKWFMWHFSHKRISVWFLMLFGDVFCNRPEDSAYQGRCRIVVHGDWYQITQPTFTVWHFLPCHMIIKIPFILNWSHSCLAAIAAVQLLWHVQNIIVPSSDLPGTFSTRWVAGTPTSEVTPVTIG